MQARLRTAGRLERRRRDHVTLDGAVSVGERQPLP
ncbi:hypothetical protein J2809_002531 [Arthrobacter pascens]|nr:hypothetical protein [Arthrobacter pascens]